MKKYGFKAVTRALLVMFALSSATSMVSSGDAWARAGQGRSIGRPSGGGGFGYRRSTPPPSSRPAPSDNYGNRPNAAPNNAPTSPAPSAIPSPATPPSSRGGFLRGLAGGLAGGFLGSMLFSSLGHGSGLGGGYGGGGGGGFGFVELLLLSGLAYLGYRWWKNRQTLSAAEGGVAAGGAWAGTPRETGHTPLGGGPTFKADQQDFGQGPSPHIDAGEVRFPAWIPEKDSSVDVPVLDKDQASDLFFRVQGAWTRRDLKPVLSILGPELERALSEDLQDLLRKGEINRMENISVRSVETLSSWTEGSTHFATVRFVANLLDYTVEEKTGRVTDGSDTEPVKFQEDWTFARSAGDDRWRVVAIEQIN